MRVVRQFSTSSKRTTRRSAHRLRADIIRRRYGCERRLAFSIGRIRGLCARLLRRHRLEGIILLYATLRTFPSNESNFRNTVAEYQASLRVRVRVRQWCWSMHGGTNGEAKEKCGVTRSTQCFQKIESFRSTLAFSKYNQIAVTSSNRPIFARLEYL